ncbi:rRNA maturation RNase YbeY [Candidatus Kaiserbacteria bacterium]|nr:rRNA maturation RNase YbeY [Candidatus Kaiserbacteria bacterium]
MTSRGIKNTAKPPRSDLGGFDIRTTVSSTIPNIPFKEIWRTILGDHYELSLVMCSDKLARRINIEHRHKDYAPNVLSFPLDKHTGEIFLNIRKAEREAREMKISPRSRIAHLYVHGCFHLAGYQHSADMERREDVILSRFKLI